MGLLTIERQELELYLQENKEKIGHTSLEGVDTVFSGITFLIPTFLSDFSHLGEGLAVLTKASCVIVGVALCAFGIYKIVHSYRCGFKTEEFLKDIDGMNQERHRFSIIAIKDTFNTYPNRYLLKYDERWNCYLFPYYRTKDSEEANAQSIQKRLSSELKVDFSGVHVERIGIKTHQKYSESAKINKYYEHTVYCATMPFRDEMKNETFSVDGERYAWMTVDAMLSNTDMRKKNEDVIKIVDGMMA